MILPVGHFYKALLYINFEHIFDHSALFQHSNELEILISVEFNMADRTVLVVFLAIAYI